MSVIPRPLKYLISTFLPDFSKICSRPKPCIHREGLCHVTVVSLDQIDFGHLYQVCIGSLTGHELNGFGHEIQCDEALRWRALKVIPQGAFDNVGTRFLLAGSIAEWNRTVDYPPNFLFERKQVALEVIWYIGDKPVSVPMMAWVDGNEIHVPLDQPISQEMSKGINHAYVPGPDEHVRRELPSLMWSSTKETWVPPPSQGMLKIELPFTEVPIVLLGDMPHKYYTPDWVSQGHDLAPLSQMAYWLYDLPWIWPQGLSVPRCRLITKWDISCLGSIDANTRGTVVEEDGSQNHVALGLPAP